MQQSLTKETEVYGFVSWITSFVLFAAYLFWAFVPENTLRNLGIVYYPSKYWAIATPVWLCAAIAFSVVFYIGLNMALSTPADSKQSVTDEFAISVHHKPGEELSKAGVDTIEAISDIPLPTVNRVLYSKRPRRRTDSAQ